MTDPNNPYQDPEPTMLDSMMVSEAVAGSKDRRTRTIRALGVIVCVLSILVLVVSGWLVYAATKNTADEGTELGHQVLQDCATGTVSGKSCEQAADTVAAALEAPAAIPGTPGRDGRDGRDGVDGVDGAQGPRGPRGHPGNDGADSIIPGPPGDPGPPGADSTIPGPQGERGRGVESVECTGTGSFTFTYTDGTTETIECTPEPSPSPKPSTSPSPSHTPQPKPSPSASPQGKGQP